jgi:hypothetical protein
VFERIFYRNKGNAYMNTEMIFHMFVEANTKL